MINKTLGLAIMFGAALSAQAGFTSSDGSYLSNLGEVITAPPINQHFDGVYADRYGALSETQNFTVALRRNQAYAYVTGFLDAAEPADVLGGRLDTASLSITDPHGVTRLLWSVKSGDFVFPVDSFGSPTTQFSGWLRGTTRATLAGNYTFHLTLTDAASGKPNTSEAFFAPVPEPSTVVAGALAGVITVAGFLRNNRRKTTSKV